MRGAPVFIVGCGRSGTTALGELLGSHDEITYLNEPRRLWGIDPRTDVRREAGEGRLDLYDVDEDLRAKLRRAFFKRAAGDTVLVEKTPVNSFRIDYIRALFPRARFLHLLRNGLDVARSIQAWCEAGRRWYGEGDVKWRRLVAYADQHGLADQAEQADDDPRLRGLLEWRLAVAHLRARLDERDLEVRYEQLITDPKRTIDAILAWLGVTSGVLDAHRLARRSAPVTAVDAAAAHIAGDLLKELGYP